MESSKIQRDKAIALFTNIYKGSFEKKNEEEEKNNQSVDQKDKPNNEEEKLLGFLFSKSMII
jgi:hypothetical protein